MLSHAAGSASAIQAQAIDSTDSGRSGSAHEAVVSPTACAVSAGAVVDAELVAGAASSAAAVSVRLSPPHEAASKTNTPRGRASRLDRATTCRATIRTECEESVSRDGGGDSPPLSRARDLFPPLREHGVARIERIEVELPPPDTPVADDPAPR